MFRKKPRVITHTTLQIYIVSEVTLNSIQSYIKLHLQFLGKCITHLPAHDVVDGGVLGAFVKLKMFARGVCVGVCVCVSLFKKLVFLCVFFVSWFTFKKKIKK